MQPYKKELPIDIKTLRSQQSSIDLFSKIEANFLEKFFKYNLTDYMHEHLVNIYEDVLEKKIKTDPREKSDAKILKIEKFLAQSMYVVKKNFTVEELEIQIESFYTERSPSIERKELPFAFKKKYSPQSAPSLMQPGEFIIVDVKIKAEVEKIEYFPERIMKYLEEFRNEKKGNQTQMEQILCNYKKETIHLFLIYFGDSNFDIFKKKSYDMQKIKIMGKNVKVNVHVFFVSKQALVETFKTVNRIENFEYINDLLIQFYELKREKQRRKRIKQAKEIERRKIKPTQKEKVYMLLGVVGLFSFGFAIRKLLL